MSTVQSSVSATRVLASDAEREQVAGSITAASAEGRLTMTEAEDRLSAVYATRYRDELAAHTSDLPAPSVSRPRRGPRDRVRVVVAVVLALFLVGVLARAVAFGAPPFVPILPLILLIAIARRGGHRRRMSTL